MSVPGHEVALTSEDLHIDPGHSAGTVKEEMKAIKESSLEYFKETMLKNHHNVLALAKARLLEREAQKNLAIQNSAESLAAKINATDQRIAELSDAVRTLTLDKQGMQTERRETRERLIKEWDADEVMLRQMIEAEEKAIKHLHGEG